MLGVFREIALEVCSRWATLSISGYRHLIPAEKVFSFVNQEFKGFDLGLPYLKGLCQ